MLTKRSEFEREIIVEDSHAFLFESEHDYEKWEKFPNKEIWHLYLHEGAGSFTPYS